MAAEASIFLQGWYWITITTPTRLSLAPSTRAYVNSTRFSRNETEKEFTRRMRREDDGVWSIETAVEVAYKAGDCFYRLWRSIKLVLITPLFIHAFIVHNLLIIARNLLPSLLQLSSSAVITIIHTTGGMKIIPRSPSRGSNLEFQMWFVFSTIGSLDRILVIRRML